MFMTERIINDTAVIILAAGKGTRMKSDKAKVLHSLLDKPMILYVLAAASRIVPVKRMILVVGHQANAVKDVVKAYPLCVAHQAQQLGTGHAIMCAIPFLADHIRNVVIMCGDVPLVQPDTIRRLLQKHIADHNDLTLMATHLDNPAGYGRIQIDNNYRMVDIIEEADATDKQKKISLVNAGIYCVSTDFIKHAIQTITNDNVQGEYYLTDIVKIGFQQKKRLGIFVGENSDEFKGINTPQDLAVAQELLKTRFV
jgi:bifunctional UDP-N-acetylglucosamine pyrophosphorylase/glucosamine-1-phosphate N-acetyltransferase/UDP-N-acetylglucosamine pyrophosphorylase